MFMLLMPADAPGLLAVAMYGSVSNWTVFEEIFVIDPEADHSAVSDYVEQHSREANYLGDACRVWRDRPETRVSIMSVLEFQKLFLKRCYRRSYLLLSYELARAIARIATDVNEITSRQAGRFVKGTTFEIRQRADGGTKTAGIAVFNSGSS
jgi:hypothetical protein